MMFFQSCIRYTYVTYVPIIEPQKKTPRKMWLDGAHGQVSFFLLLNWKWGLFQHSCVSDEFSVEIYALTTLLLEYMFIDMLFVSAMYL